MAMHLVQPGWWPLLRGWRAKLAGAVLSATWIALPVGNARAAALSDIGFQHGLTLRGPHATAEVYFPLPNGVVDADLAIDLYPSVAIDPLSTLTVIVDDEPLATIGTRDGSRLVHIPIPRRLAQTDFLRVRFASDQALRRDEQCFDNDNPAVWTHIGPRTSLNATGSGEPGIGAIWRELSGEVAISLPTEPTLADIQTALILSVALVKRGAQPSITAPDDPRAKIRVGPGQAPIAVAWRSELSAAIGAGPLAPSRVARLTVATPAAARALVSAGATMRGVAASDADGEPSPTPAPSAANSVSLAEIGVHPATLEVFSTAQVTMEIPFDRLPAARHPVALQLFGRAAAPPLEEALVVTVSASGRLLWSQTFRGSADLDGVHVDLPDPVVRNHMPVTLRVVRVGTRRVCGADDALAFDLRDSTRVLFGEGYTPPVNFAGLAMPADRPALVRVDVAPPAVAAAVPLLARLLSDAGARPPAIDVVDGSAALDRPFIVVADLAPKEITAGAPARPELGRVVLDRPSDGTRVVLTDTNRLTVVQVALANGVPGLWLSPGARATLANPAPLSNGDVAVFDGVSPVPIAFDTHTQSVVVERPMGSMTDSLLTRWRSELFVVTWIAITLLAVWVILRLRRARRSW